MTQPAPAPDFDPNAVEARLREAGIPLGRLYEATGISPSTWWRWKTGSRTPSRSSVLGVTRAVDALLTAEPEAA